MVGFQMIGNDRYPTSGKETAVFTRFAACCASVLLILATVHAQQTPPPGQEGPPSVEFPPPRVEDGGPRRQDSPPPRVEGAPPSQDTPPPRVQGPPGNERPPRADTPPRDPPDRAPTRTADRCGAVAYTADGAFGAAYGMDDCADAERLAADECRRESTDKQDCSRGVVVRRDTWFHIQFCQRGSEWTTQITTRQTLAEVNRAASEWAQKSQFGAQNCRQVPNGLLHSGGLHTKM